MNIDDITKLGTEVVPLETVDNKALGSTVQPQQPSPMKIDPRANVKLGINGTALPEGPFNMGMITVEIPDEDTQRGPGFFIEPEKLGAFMSQVGGYEYKEVKPKG